MLHNHEEDAMTKKNQEEHPWLFDIYNLEFPSYREELHINGYIFRRVKNYKTRFLALQHCVSCLSEFQQEINQGSLQVTATVQVPISEKGAVFRSGDLGSTELDDILLLLSILTRRDVFSVRKRCKSGLMRIPHLPEGAIVFNSPHCYPAGGIARVSMPRLKTESDLGHGHYDGALEHGITAILELTRSTEWRTRYNEGHFLTLFNLGMSNTSLEGQFTLCWTIWEHLFAVLNRNELEPHVIRNIRAEQKIQFIFSELFQLQDMESLKLRVKPLVRARNRLVHNGFFPEDNEQEQEWHKDAAVLFVELTERVVVRILEIGEAANHLNTIERLERWLKGERPDIPGDILSATGD